ncbi:MAG: DUF3987 domain-containing protein [Thermoguttaceae bacterium]|nr:DUF3987 domain-containing protein [Thermoguttaceae bacterium]
MEATQELKRMAAGRWPEILRALGGLPSELLDGKNHPCPRCGGNDRFRFSNLDGNGSCYCNQCFKAGNGGDGLAALQWLRGWDFPTAKTELAKYLGVNLGNGRGTNGNGRRAGGGGKIVKTYDYRDESGTLLFQVCRIEPKDFRQRRPDGRGGWTWSVKGIRTVPYRLPELVAEPERPVVVAEGEKDCDNLARIVGVLATCNAGGAGKWNEEHAKHLAGRRVVILPDNDERGQQHAQQVAASLYGLAESVRIVDLPGLPPKGDVSDWIAAGGSKEKLLPLLRGAAEWQPTAEPWPELERFDERSLPGFPAHVLPAVLREWVETESHATQTPPDLAGLLALAVCSSLIARRVVVEPRPGWTEPVNLYVAVLLEPGNRKSAVFADALAPLREIEAELVERDRGEVTRALCERRQMEARLRRLEKVAAERGDAEARREAGDLAVELDSMPEPALPRLLVDDATSEKLGMVLADQGGRIASMSPEGGVFDLMAGLYSKSGMPQFGIYLLAHAGDDLVTDRVSRKSVRVERPALTCAYAIQPAVIAGLAGQVAFRGRGLLARFLYSFPSSPIGRRQVAAAPVPESVSEAYRRAVRLLATDSENIEYAPEPFTLRLTAGAEAALRGWEQEIEDELADGGKLEAMRDWGSKLAGATLRLAAVLHCVEHGLTGEVTTGTLAAAIEIARALIPHAEAVLNLMGDAAPSGASDGQYVLKWIERHGKREFTKSEAQQHGKRRFPRAEDIDPAINELARRGYVRQQPAKASGPGRPPSPTYEVNPAVFEIGNARNCSRYSKNSGSEAPEGSFQNIQNVFQQNENQNRVQMVI